jgi:hypothetical protein
MGNVDPRQQRNPSTASPFGGSMTTARPEPINYEAPQPGRPYMGVGIQPQQPYGMQPMQPYGIPRPIGLQGQPMMPVRSPVQQLAPHTHGENGEIIQEPMPLIRDQGVDSKMAQYQAQYQAQLAHDNGLPPRGMSPGIDPTLQRVGGVQSFYK